VGEARLVAGDKRYLDCGADDVQRVLVK